MSLHCFWLQSAADIENDPLWKIQSELLAVDDLTSEMDLVRHFPLVHVAIYAVIMRVAMVRNVST